MTDELYHYGTIGMKWHVRRFQNPDGTLTPLGRQRYSAMSGSRRHPKGQISKQLTTIELASIDREYENARNDLNTKRKRAAKHFLEKHPYYEPTTRAASVVAQRPDTAPSLRAMADLEKQMSEVYGKDDKKYRSLHTQYLKETEKYLDTLVNYSGDAKLNPDFRISEGVDFAMQELGGNKKALMEWASKDAAGGIEKDREYQARAKTAATDVLKHYGATRMLQVLNDYQTSKEKRPIYVY